jgi:hypothetical protein
MPKPTALHRKAGLAALVGAPPIRCAFDGGPLLTDLEHETLAGTGFGLLPPDVRAFKDHAAFHRVPEAWEF